MKYKHAGLLIFLIINLLIGCSGQATTPEAFETRTLSPGQVDSSMVDEVVKVKGRIAVVVHNPGGLGGIYLKFDSGNVDVRIQPGEWDALTEKERGRFKEGNTITAEGLLFQAGRQLVVVFGKYQSSSNTTPLLR